MGIDPFSVPRVGVGLAVIKGRQVLLHKRKGKHAAGLWSFPGGHLELYEEFWAAALRELEEEAGPIEVTKPVKWTFANTVYPDEEKQYVVVFMKSHWISGEAKVMEPEKNEGWGWFDWKDLPRPLIPGIEEILSDGLSPI